MGFLIILFQHSITRKRPEAEFCIDIDACLCIVCENTLVCARGAALTRVTMSSGSFPFACLDLKNKEPADHFNLCEACSARCHRK
jgi:hypothetical protein